jgi:hypothetical protein
MTQSDPAALELCVPSEDELLPNETEEPLPELPGLIVVELLSPLAPLVIVVELLFGWLSSRVTTRHGLPLTMTVPFGPEVTVTLSATAGHAEARDAASSKPAALAIRIENLRNLLGAPPSPIRSAAAAALPE